MKLALALMATLAGPVYAQSVPFTGSPLPENTPTAHHWGTSSVTLTPGEDVFALLVFHNTMTPQENFPGGSTTVTLTLEGVDVEVSLTPQPQNAPDTLRVSVPEGYMAIPSEVIVPDGSLEAVTIYDLSEGLYG